MIVVADQHAAEVLPPGTPPLHLPAPLVPASGPSILGFSLCAVRSMGRHQLNALARRSLIERVAIVGVVPDQRLGSVIDHTRGESWFDKGDCMRRSPGHGGGERQTSTVCHGHDLRPLAPRGLSHTAPLVWPPRPCRRCSTPTDQSRPAPPDPWPGRGGADRGPQSVPTVGHDAGTCDTADSASATPSMARRSARSRAPHSSAPGAAPREVSAIAATRGHGHEWLEDAPWLVRASHQRDPPP
jgi:hypothetical protein